MPLSTTVIVLRVDCITENFGRVERGCSGDIGGVGYCLEFFRQKNTCKLFIDSSETLWYTRASLYQYGHNTYWHTAIFGSRKKIEKISNTPLRISAGCDIISALTAQEDETDIVPSIAGRQAHLERAVN